jgi:hypothetical protein
MTIEKEGMVHGVGALVVSLLLIIFVMFAELYRDLALCMAAESLAENPYLENDAGWHFKRALDKARLILGCKAKSDAPQACSRKQGHNCDAEEGQSDSPAKETTAPL